MSLRELLAALLLLASVLAGDIGGWGAVGLQGLAGLGLAWAWTTRAGPTGGWPVRTMGWLLLGGFALTVLQLTPLPPAVYAALPGRGSVLADLAVAGLDPGWRPMSLDIAGTVRALLAWQLFGAMWWLCIGLDEAARMRLVHCTVMVAVVLALWGCVESLSKADTTGAAAAFANRNHFATFMAMVIPMSMATTLKRGAPTGMAWTGTACAVLLLLAAALSYSRTGFVLAAGAFLASLAFLHRGAVSRPDARMRRMVAGAALGAGVMAVLVLARTKLLARFMEDPVRDLRWQYLEWGLPATRDQFPWGSGLGSFRWVYQGYEPAHALSEFNFATHAHNELLELAIESGPAGLLLAALFVTLASVGMARAWRGGPDAVLARAAAVSCTVPLLHSLVDFPLRTAACSALLALVASLLLAPFRTAAAGQGMTKASSGGPRGVA